MVNEEEGGMRTLEEKAEAFKSGALVIRCLEISEHYNPQDT